MYYKLIQQQYTSQFKDPNKRFNNSNKVIVYINKS